MSVLLVVLGAVLMTTSVVVLCVGAWGSGRRQGPTYALAPTILFAFGLMLMSVGWLTSPGTPATAAEAVRSGSLASAAVLALYALWLNDQRRRTEQERLDNEKERGRIEQGRLIKELDQLGMERMRIVDERFTKAIELLGDDSDRVRIGALILLDSLTRTRSELIPDVLDQICGYLRGPVDTDLSNPLAGERERRVRRHAQRVLSTVLRRATETTPIPDIDLSGAELDEFCLDGGTVGALRLDNARLTGRTVLRGMLVKELTMNNCTTDNDVMLERALTRGRVDRLVIYGKQTRIGGRFICEYDLGTVDIESVTFEDSVELNDLAITGHFAAHSDFRRLTMARVTFAAPTDATDDTSIDLFRCEFGGLVLLDDVDVYGVVRLAGVKFNGGLELGARFHNFAIVEEALVAARYHIHLPAGWHHEDNDAAYRRLVVR